MQALTVGSLAHQQLQRARSAVISGRTSGGIFLRLDTHWVIFLSWDEHPGPLTIQLPQPLPGGYQAGTKIQVKPDGLYFSPMHDSVDLRIAEIWRAPLASPVPDGHLPPAERVTRLGELARLASAQRYGAGWSALLPGYEARLEALAGLPPIVRPALERLRAALARQDHLAAVEILSALLGLGNGLTPSGDDLALGLLLTISRWGEALAPQLHRSGYVQQVVQLARRTTSDLSASLIEAAALGQADPRLIAALDSLVIGHPGLLESAAGLAEWGHSSGLDALLGMSLVIV